MDSSSDFLNDLVDVDLGLLGADVWREGRSKGVRGVESCCDICEASSAEEFRLIDLCRGPLIVDLLRANSAKLGSSVTGEADFVDSVVTFSVP
jgi:hypothetical protein